MNSDSEAQRLVDSRCAKDSYPPTIYFEHLKLTRLPQFPTGRKILRVLIKNCEIEEVEFDTNCWIENLCFDECTNLKKIIRLPGKIGFLQFYNCTALEEIQMLPEGLDTLDIQNTPLLKSIPRIPFHICGLNLIETRITTLPTQERNNPCLVITGGPFRVHTRDGKGLAAAWKKFWELKKYMDAGLKEEIVAAAWHPKRVTAWMDAGIEIEAL